MQHNQTGLPGIVIAALRGGAGKTIFSVGTIAALKKLGHRVAPFKKGPDYIDAGWLALAAGRPCYNLDTYLIDPDQIVSSFRCYARNTDLAVIEGNRGLYDTIDISVQTSTAELAKLLDLPVVLCIDGTKTTRTMAAVVLGCQHFDPDVKIKGVVLNRVAGKRHENNLRRNIEHYCGIPVVGAVPKLKTQSFPERHMGLVPTPEHDWAQESIAAVAEVAANYLDLETILTIARDNAAQAANACSEAPLQEPPVPCATLKRLELGAAQRKEKAQPRIGVIKDSAFQFYYQENFEALEAAGAELVYTSPLREPNLPDVDALYIGGGFPETHARELAQNQSYREHIKQLADQGLPIYAECGGLMYLGRDLVLEQETFPMVGIFPLTFGLFKKPQGHGYTILDVESANPYYAEGSEIRGHEFHYSKVIETHAQPLNLAFKVKRGRGLVDDGDGICYKNVLATYTHVHAFGTPTWAEALVQTALQHRASRF
jgi:cobyrinic acid a,c-diamide synthase